MQKRTNFYVSIGEGLRDRADDERVVIKGEEEASALTVVREVEGYPIRLGGN
jgi:hypothetical protein